MSTFKCKCRCIKKCGRERDCGCDRDRDCDRDCDRGCDRGCDHDYDNDCGCDHDDDNEWLKQKIKEAYWKGFREGCKKCSRKDNDYDDCDCDR
ncbi:hypothetical protein LBYZC6_51690 [Lacrimispora brassicae]